MALRAFLTVAAVDVEFALEDATIGTWVLVRAPIVELGSVTNAFAEDAADQELGGRLPGLNALWPAFDHPDATILDEAPLGHRTNPSGGQPPNVLAMSCKARLVISP
jgi:hypothetical protein